MITAGRSIKINDYAKALVIKANKELGRGSLPEVSVIWFYSVSRNYQLTGASILKLEKEKDCAEIVLYVPSILRHSYNGETIRDSFRSHLGNRFLIYVGTVPPGYKGLSIRLGSLIHPKDFTIKRKKFNDLPSADDEVEATSSIEGNTFNDVNDSEETTDNMNNIKLLPGDNVIPCRMKCIYIPKKEDVNTFTSDEDVKEEMPLCFLRGGVDWFIRLFEVVYESGDTIENLHDKGQKRYDQYFLEPSMLYEWSDCAQNCSRHIKYEKTIIRTLLYISLTHEEIKVWMIKAINAAIYRRLYIRMQHARRLNNENALIYHVLHLNGTKESSDIKTSLNDGMAFCTQTAWKIESVLKEFISAGKSILPFNLENKRELLPIIFETLLRLNGILNIE